MKATGIIRRVDDLGRVCVPKEVRKEFGIKEGTPLELFINDDEIIFKKRDYAIEFKQYLNRLKGSFEDIKSEIGESKSIEIESHISVLEDLIRQ